jgi:hypothetical protein
LYNLIRAVVAIIIFKIIVKDVLISSILPEKLIKSISPILPIVVNKVFFIIIDI